jgi:hypothetical protein
MPTLTGTGAINLTTPTNWSPAQIPAPGDDLIIGNATLTLDADFTANTVTFNNAASRVAFTGTTRTLTATNGFFVTANLGGNRLCQTDVATGLTLDIFGKWTISAGASAANIIANVNGGTLNLSTVGGVQSNQLFEVNSGSIFSIFTQSSGRTNTTGLLNYSASSSIAGTITNVSGGTWEHYSNGTNSFVSTNSTFNLFSFSGSGTSITLNGNWLGTSTVRFSAMTSFTGTITFNGNITFPAASPFIVTTNGTLVIVNGEIDVSVFSNSSVGILRWQNQSRTVAANRSLSLGMPAQIAGLVIENFGKILFGSGVVPDANTQIRMRNLAAQIFCSDANLDTRVLPFQTTAPTLPSVQNVAAGTVYGYAGFTQTGTGLILDPAVLASAVDGSVWGKVRPQNPVPGTYGAVSEWAGNVDEQSVADIVFSSLISGPSTGGNWPNGSFGRRVLVGSSTQREVAVTGSHHVAADVHEFQPDVIDSDAIATSAITEIAGGVWSAASSAYSAATGTMGLVMYAFSQMLENVSGWRWKEKALEQAPTGGGNNVVNVLPAVGISAERQAGVVLSPFVGETITQSITLYATDGTTPINLSGKSLEIVFQTRSGTDVAVIANANITLSGTSNNIVTFAYPSAVTTTERTLRVSLRDNAAPRTVYLSGLCKVSIAPAVDA